MRKPRLQPEVLILPFLLVALPAVSSLSFNLAKQECFAEHVSKGTDVVISFVAREDPRDRGRPGDVAVDFELSDPNGRTVHSLRSEREGTAKATAWVEGGYQFCFTNAGRHSLVVSFETVELQNYSSKQAQVTTTEDVDKVQQEILRLQNEVYFTKQDVWYSFFLALQQIDLDKELGKKLIEKTVAQAIVMVLCCVTHTLLLRQIVEGRTQPSRV